MGFFRKFISDPKEQQKNEEREAAVIREVAAAQEAQPEPEPATSPYQNVVCPHTVLTPRWDSIEDMGKQDRATSFYCQGCDRTFSPDEARPYLV